MKKAIIIDFDGVIIESEKGGFNLLKKLADEYFQLHISDDMFDKKLGKSTLAFLEAYYAGQLKAENRRKLYDDYKLRISEEIERHVTIHYDVVNYIKQNSEIYDFAVASMNTKAFIRQVLQNLDIYNLFQTIVTREEITKHKPDPEIYLKTLQALKTSKEHIIAVEDSRSGVIAAVNAGINVIGVVNTTNSMDEFQGLTVLGVVNADNFSKDIGKILNIDL